MCVCVCARVCVYTTVQQTSVKVFKQGEKLQCNAFFFFYLGETGLVSACIKRLHVFIQMTTGQIG